MSDYTLYKGHHAKFTERRCAMEFVAYLAGEPHTDEPKCVDEDIAWFCRNVNDELNDEDRQRLRPYLARTIGTANDGHEKERGALWLELLAILDCSPFMNVGALARRAARKDVDFVCEWLDRLLPTIPLQLPVAPDAEKVCAA